MRPKTRSNPDPHNRSRLAELDDVLPSRLNLDYRSHPHSFAVDEYLALTEIWAAAVLGMVSAVVVLVGALWLSSGIVLAYLVGFGVWCGSVACRPYLDVRQFVLVTVSTGVLPWLIFRLLASVSPLWVYAVGFPLLLIALVMATDAMLLHCSMYLRANPRLDHGTRRSWYAVWIHRRGEKLVHCLLYEKLARPTRRSMEHVEYPEIEALASSLWALIAAYGVGLALALAAPPALAGTAGLIGFTVTLLPFAIRHCLRYRHVVGLPTSHFLRALNEAYVNWMTYNAHDSRAPGVFRSPHGPAVQRSALLHGLSVAAGIVLISMCTFFPLGRVISDTSWWTVHESRRRAHRRAVPSVEQLSAPRRAYLEALPESLQHDYLMHTTRRSASTPKRARFINLDSNEHSVASLSSSSIVWLWHGIEQGDPLAVYSSVGTVVACITCPPLVVGLVVFSLAARPLMHYYMTLEVDGATYHRLEGPELACYAQRVRTSPNKVEREHLLIGVDTKTDSPILLDREILNQPAHIVGSTGTGKTARALTPLLSQLLSYDDTSFLIIDCKGDMAMFEEARIGAERHGKRFRWITNEMGLSTYAFNPLRQRGFRRLSPNQRAEVLLAALSMDPGEIYGGSHFRDANCEMLTRVLEAAPQAETFADLFLASKRIRGDSKLKEAASHIFRKLEALSRIDLLNVGGDARIHPAVVENAVDVEDLLYEPQLPERTGEVVYMYLPASFAGITVRHVSWLVLQSLLVSASRQEDRHLRQSRRTHVIIDEFQQIVARGIDTFLRQSRSMRISLMLAHQAMSDLKNRDVDLLPTVESNSRYRQAFSAPTNTDQRRISETSGEQIYELGGWTVHADDFPYRTRRAWLNASFPVVNVHECIGPRISPTAIAELTDHPSQSVLHVVQGSRYTQFAGLPLTLHSDFHIDKTEYERRLSAEWPAPTKETLVAPLNRNQHAGSWPERTASESAMANNVGSTEQSEPAQRCHETQRDRVLAPERPNEPRPTSTSGDEGESDADAYRADLMKRLSHFDTL